MGFVKMVIGFIKRAVKAVLPYGVIKIYKEHRRKQKHEETYDHWLISNIKNSPYGRPALYTTFSHDSPYGEIINKAMYEAEYLYDKELLLEVKQKNIEGSVVEFGVSEGWRLFRIINSMKEIGLNRDIYGFDSFEGLPKPDYTNDNEWWKEGMYAANFDDVKERLKCSENPHIKLIKGWFSDTFKLELARDIEKIAFARIDCDLYQPAVECLCF